MATRGALRRLPAFIMAVLATGLLAAAGGAAAYDKAASVSKPAAKAVDVGTCYGCHDNIKEFHAKGKHAKVNCAACHEGTDAHVAKGGEVKPVTRTDHAACAVCHKDQYESFKTVNLKAKARVEKATFTGKSPMFDKLIAGHGFAKEHGQPRSHVFMLMDQYIVDRSFGGRFQMNDWTEILNAEGAATRLWKIIGDADPKSGDQKIFIKQGAAAANPVCLNCKTQDHILQWKYMGDPDPRAKWSRTSKVVEFARDVSHPMNCFMCHDPHSTQPRVVRDALINAVVDRGEGTYPYDKAKSQKTTMTKVGFRDGFRNIGILNKADSNVMCAQCHVEYNCNPGFDTKTGEYSVTMADQRTNFFPWVNVFDYKAKMDSVSFRDFKHATTGALLNKLQHPESETYWMSKHERAGVECKDCHMPKVKTAKGKSFTSHQQKSPRLQLKETCLKCHGEWSEQQAEYQIDAIQSYTRGKVTKAEYWLGQFIDTFVRAKGAGVPEDVLNKAREQHDIAHSYWEWWTAENSQGFHNPQNARESLARSMDASQAGIKLLTEAMAAKK